MRLIDLLITDPDHKRELHLFDSITLFELRLVKMAYSAPGSERDRQSGVLADIAINHKVNMVLH